MHHHIKHCGIKFLENEYPFKAHCTIHFKGKINSWKKKQILNTKIPTEKFEINTFSLISDYNYLNRFALSGTKISQFKGV